MKASNYFRLTAIGIAMFGSGGALANEPPQPADPAQQTRQSASTEERSAYREQMQERMRNMTPEEQRIMRESSVDGRARMENQQAAQGDDKRRGSRDGGGRGMGAGRHR